MAIIKRNSVVFVGWVVGWLVWVGLWVELISHKTRDAIPYSYTNLAEYFSTIYVEYYCTRIAAGRR